MAGASDELLFAQGVRRTSRHRAVQISEGPQGLGADAAIDSQPHTALESSNRLFGMGTEHTVDPVGGEPKREETFLKLGHVIALQHVARDVREDSVAQLPVGPVQGDMGMRSEHSVNHQATSLLEGSDRFGHLFVVDSGGFESRWSQVASGLQQGADGTYRCSLVADAI